MGSHRKKTWSYLDCQDERPKTVGAFAVAGPRMVADEPGMVGAGPQVPAGA